MNDVSSSAPRALERRGVVLKTLPALWADGLALLAALVACVLFLRAAPLASERAFSLGSTDSTVARNFQLAETSDDGRGFRWTNGDSTLLLPPLGRGDHTLRFAAAAPRPNNAPVPLHVTLNDAISFDTTLSDRPRRFALMLPATHVSLGQNIVRLQSPTFVPQEVNNDPERKLGVAVFEVDWRVVQPQRWLVPAQVVAIMLAATLLYTMLVFCGIPFGWRGGALLLYITINLAMRHSDSRFVFRWHALVATLAVACGLLVAVAAARRQRTATIALPWRRWLREHWRPLVGFGVATLVMLAPLVSTFTSRIPGPPGDNLEYLWKMEWYRVALLIQHVSPTFVPQIFYPTGAELTISEMAPAHMLLWLPVTALAGGIASYNGALLVSFILSGFFTSLLARRLGASAGAAFVAGLIFAFSLRRFYHITGHFGMMGTQWLPLALYGWEGVLTRRRPWDGFVCGAGLVLASWSTLHYGATFPFLLLLYAPIRLGWRALPGLLDAWRPIVLAGALCVAFVLPVALPYAETQALGLTFGHRYEQLLLHSSTLTEYVLPSPYHPLWGAWASQFYRLQDGGEHNFGIGYTALLLAIVGIYLNRRSRLVWALVAISVVNVVMSLGPEWIFADGTSIKLPVWYVVNYLPVLSGIRTWSRMAMYVVLCVSLLTALALSTLPPWLRRGAWPIAGLLVLIEMASLLPFTTPQPRPVDLWIGQQSGNGAVVQIPNGFGGQSEYYTLFTGKPTNQGTGKFPPPAFREGQNRLLGFPDDSARRLFQRWGTQYIVIDTAAMDQTSTTWRSRLGAFPQFQEVYRDDSYVVYRFADPLGATLP